MEFTILKKYEKPTPSKAEDLMAISIAISINKGFNKLEMNAGVRLLNAVKRKKIFVKKGSETEENINEANKDYQKIMQKHVEK